MATKTLSILFSDIVGSSRLYQQFGNSEAEEKIRFVIETLSACAEKHSGTIVKTIGDEIMCSFEQLNDSALAAIEMNQLVHESGTKLRTGISIGELVERDGDLFGDGVNNAAFLTKYARPQEILIDETSLDNSGTPILYTTELIGQMTIKGKQSPCMVYRLNWEKYLSKSMGVTQIDLSSLSDTANTSPTLTLTYLGRQFMVSRERPVFVVGRDKDNVSLKISHAKISRRHVSIRFEQGKFVLEDHSVNGTYITQVHHQITQVHREAFALIGEGELLLGQSRQDDNCTIRYKIS